MDDSFAHHEKNLCRSVDKFGCGAHHKGQLTGCGSHHTTGHGSVDELALAGREGRVGDFGRGTDIDGGTVDEEAFRVDGLGIVEEGWWSEHVAEDVLHVMGLGKDGQDSGLYCTISQG